MLTSFILLKLNLPPIELKAETGEDRKRYLKAMQKGDDGDLTFLETLINNALSESLEKIRSGENPGMSILPIPGMGFQIPLPVLTIRAHFKTS